jgi:hypothetical protein
MPGRRTAKNYQQGSKGSKGSKGLEQSGARLWVRCVSRLFLYLLYFLYLLNLIYNSNSGGLSMGRGAQSQTRQLTDEQLASLNSLNQQFQGQQQQIGNTLLPQFQSILNNPGLSPADKAAVTGQSQGSLASAFDSLQQSAQNRLARTRNSAGFGELTDELARQKGIAEAGQAQQNQLAFSNTAFQRQMAALQGLSGLFGVDSNLLGRTLGIPAELLNVRNNASRTTGNGFFSALGSGVGSALGALPGAFF